ncbi:enolase C-terminal domain-like protein [Mycolicibacterium bacteremicum]|uniref:enolase C-terminal domain-like protein n=1 Tax=Mycolicibacterium bacteremicum TaxID=564198 RepID=UPI0009F1D188|nr:enolase C-terminal domain-like protein [Mycolicibacterium bacteremicum]MCV7433645.1 O-succinylbenzoate synthase [Mycolicibacterium bacteremicum]
MQTLIDLEAAPVFAVPLRDGGVHEGILLEGPQGWGEFSPPPDCPDDQLGRWLTAATEAGTVGWPDAVRGRVPAAVGIGAVDPQRAHTLAAESGCQTATVEVHTGSGEDVDRVAAVRDALGPDGAIRCDARGRWDADTAVSAIAALEGAAGRLEFIARPCADMGHLQSVRSAVDVPVAMYAAPNRNLRGTADIAILHCGTLGGARRALRVAETGGLPCLVTSGTQTSVGASVGVALAGALPELRYACDLSAGAVLAADAVGASRTLLPVDGFLPVAPMSPAPTAQFLREYSVTDPERNRWWRRRLQTAIAQ